MRIGQLLLARGRTTRAALERAWSLRVLFGDRLGTNLLSEALVSEEELASALGTQHGVRAAWGANISIDPRVARRVPGSVATAHRFIPHHQSGDKVYVLMAEPHAPEALEEARARLGQRIVPVVVCEARLWKCLYSLYGTSPGLRPIPLDDDVRLFQALRRSKAESAEAAAPADGPELMTEAEFNAVYMREGGADETGSGWKTLDGEQHAGPGETDANPFDDNDETLPAHGDSAEAILLTSIASDADGVYLEQSEEDEDTGEFSTVSVTNFGAPVGAAAEVTVEDVLAAHTVPRRDLDVVSDEPLSFEEAEALLRQAHHRDDIAEIVLRAALARYHRAALLTVHPGMVVGWKGRGEDLTDILLRGYQCRLSERHVFSLVVKSRAHYLGPLARWAGHAAWVKHTHRKIPRTIAVFPVLVRGRVVNLLYGDNGHDAVADSDVGELLVLAQRIAQSYETMLSD